jgi:hypothetical protein
LKEGSFNSCNEAAQENDKQWRRGSHKLLGVWLGLREGSYNDEMI